jgi:hypothetical protein
MFIGYFAEKLNVDSAFKAELYCTIRTIKLAYQKNCWNLLLKTDSTLVILAFKSSTIVPYSLKTNEIITNSSFEI